MSSNKMLFKNHTKYSKKNYNKFIEFHNDKFGLVYDISTTFILILFIYCFIVTLKGKAFVLSFTFFVAICVFLGYRILQPVYVIKKQLKSKTIAKENEIVLYFYEKSFKVRENKDISKLKYWQLHRVYETDKFFYLYLTKKYAFLVDKSGFTMGTLEDFTAFIKNKMKFKYKNEC